MTTRLLWACLLSFLPATAVVAEEGTAPARSALLASAAHLPSGRGVLRDPPGVPMEVRTARAEATGGATSEDACLLQREGSSQVGADRCLACHGGAFGTHTSHPVDVDFQGAGRRGNSTVRSLEESVRRGAFLPDGQVRCTSCHDGRSPFAHRIALPPGAEIRHAVRAGDPGTYEAEARPVGRVQSRAGAPQVAAGQEVAVRPLCLTCHPMD